MKEFSYEPQPMDTEDVVLSQEIMDLAEILAENTHLVWSERRIAEGWRFGAERNDIRKETPCLVPYLELPESEKEYDRNTALETLKLIVKLGYTITKDTDNR